MLMLDIMIKNNQILNPDKTILDEVWDEFPELNNN